MKLKKVEKLSDIYSIIENSAVNQYVGSHKQDILKSSLYDSITTLPKEYEIIFSIINGLGFLAGGSVRCLVEKINNEADFDVYAYKAENRKILVDKFIENGFTPSFYNLNCVMMKKDKMNVQIIFTFVGQILDVVDEFDFTICRIGTDGVNLFKDKDFDENNYKKIIRIKTIQCPVSSVRRIIKYAKKGYFITNFQILKLYEDFLKRTPDYREKLLELLSKQDSNNLTDEDLNALYILMKVVD